ncbi:MAG: glycosyltransferase family 2 protein [Chitinophagaceae bacterium]|jgi:GT2 family glycosyltransferase|nr:glycosyltransferase family 2 protein [Chitinophagaceae bacterium]
MKQVADSSLSLDVIIPSYRFDQNDQQIAAIVSLAQPENWNIRFYLIADHPTAAIPASIQQLIHDGRLQFSRNESNRGLSYTRNRGIDLSMGEWILFLDDDIVPAPDLLLQFTRAILDEPAATAFGGVVRLPAPVNDFTQALTDAGYTHFFQLAANEKELPWPVGASMLYRRDKIGSIRFSENFGKDGGEEVDFAIQVKKEAGGRIIAVPAAIIDHPWWHDGRPDFSRPFRYSRGNYWLITRHPAFAQWRFSNTTEMIFLLLLLTPLSYMAGVSIINWLGIMVCLLVADAILYIIKQAKEKGRRSWRQWGYGWLVKMAEQMGYLVCCLQHGYLQGLWQKFDIELRPGRKRHFHTNRWVWAKMGIMLLSFFLLCRG